MTAHDTGLIEPTEHELSPDHTATHHRALFLLDVQVAMLSEPPIGIPAAASVRANLAQILVHARAARPPAAYRARAQQRRRRRRGRAQYAWLGARFPAARRRGRRRQAQEQRVRGDAARRARRTRRGDCRRGLPNRLQHPRNVLLRTRTWNEVLLIRGAHATYDRIEVLHGGGVTPASRIEAEIEAELEEAGVHILEMKDVPGIFMDR